MDPSKPAELLINFRYFWLLFDHGYGSIQFF